MGLDLWFRGDVARILQATRETMISSLAAADNILGEDPNRHDYLDGYRRGFEAALQSMATAFGVGEERPAIPCHPLLDLPQPLPDREPDILLPARVST